MTWFRRTSTRLAARQDARPWTDLVVVAAVVFVVAASVARAFTYPPLEGGDEPAHFDYVLSVWHAHLPVFEDGITHHAPFGSTTPVQWVAQHPPLYYLVLAPVVGPLFDSGDALLAVLAGRLMSAVMAGGVVLASAWAAWRCFPTARLLPGAVAVVTAFAGMLVQQGGSIYNDVLFVLFSVLACGIAGAALRTGVTSRLLVGAAIVGAGGMATRLSFALWLVALVVALAVARTVRFGRLTGVPARLLAAAVPVVTAALASGWFWFRNQQLTGSFSGRQADWGIENMGRVVRPRTEVATDPDFWTGLFGIYRGVLDPAEPIQLVQWVLMILPMVLAGVVGLWEIGRFRTVPATTGRRRDRTSTTLIVLMFLAVAAILTVVEIDYVHGGGAPNTRYSLTILPIITIVIGAGLTALPRLFPVLLTAWVLLAWVPYLSLVDLQVSTIVPDAAGVVQVSVGASAVAAVVIVVGAFGARRRGWPAAVTRG
ncbi:hypothetical protein [Curtobacterium sp. MCSS17_007]|uniref:hypothetical protein n=1 Tax=Curtobacterium sp. MCSS17_007 TaxID=2175646 RepID=UPI000DB74508|nr:hypothetical protein [Curtobacterium sp. MCSS17_007]WIE75746.1 hypothetical protein DEJ22_000340 [Curtobacterium sp. MCSS17_007]